MIRSQFFKSLFITLALLVLVLVPIHLIKGIKPFIDLSTILIIFFVLLSVTVYLVGERFSTTKNKYLYNQLIILNFVAKLGLSIGIMVVYDRINNPESNLFIVPFGIIYLAFTIFETIFMTRQAKLSD